jgi:Tfp pilus assembly protein PilX
MKLNFFNKSARPGKDAGIALLTTMLLLFLMSSLLVGFGVLLFSNQQLAGANNDQVVAFYAAEAGMEKMTADLGALFSQTYSPGISQITALETTPYGPPVSSLFPSQSVTYTTADGTPAYTITPDSVNTTTGNPQATPTNIKSGPYQGMTALATTYTLSVNARTSTGREVNLVRTTQTVGIPMFQFAIFCDVDCSFHAGSNFTVNGRVHGNGNLFLGSGATLTMQAKVDAYKDIIRAYMDNGASTSANWSGNVSITTTPTGGSYRNLALTEGSVNGTSCISGWTTVSTGNSPADYASNLINGKGSPNCAAYSTGAEQLNLAVVTMGGGTTQSIDLIRRPIVGESSNVTGERYFAQSSLVILLSDNPTDIMSLPCVDQTTQPMDLSVLAQPVASWPSTTAPYSTLLSKMTTYGTTPLPLAASGSAAAYSSSDGYWLPAGYPIIKGYLKIQVQTAYGAPCGTWQDVTAEVLALGYAGRNINPVSQSISTNNLNAAWPGSTTQMDTLSNAAGTTHYYTTTLATATPPNELVLNAGYTYPLPNLPTAQIGPQGQNIASMAAGTYTGQTGTCMDPHPNAIIRLERIRDNPSSLYAAHYKSGSNYYNYVNSGAKSGTNEPVEAPVAVVCGVDPATGKLPILMDTAGNTATWTPQPWDFWNNALFDPREGELRDGNTPLANSPTLNGTMHYIELDVKNLAKWFAGTIGTSGTLAYDSNNAPNDFSVYISDRRGNYAAASTETWTGGWPPLSPTGRETGEYGWNDFVNSVSSATYGCPNNSLDTGEDLDGINQLLTYGSNSTNINYIMDPGATEASLYTLLAGAITGTNTTGGLNSTGAYGEFGFYSGLVASGAIVANPNCAAPTYASATPGIWPMMYSGVSNASRVNPPIFFRRAVKIVDANNLTGLGTCPAGVVCGLALAIENPVYVQGDYNANSAGNGFSDPDVGSSIAGDSVTILSNNWNDVNSYSYSLYANNGPRLPAATYWRAAVIGGKGVSFPQFGSSADNGTDGGMHNFLRYVENWGGGSFTVNYEGALVNLFTNRQGTGFFKYGNTVYTVPTRVASFDTNFLTPANLPPRTPMFREINTTGWTRMLTPGASYK